MYFNTEMPLCSSLLPVGTLSEGCRSPAVLCERLKSMSDRKHNTENEEVPGAHCASELALCLQHDGDENDERHLVTTMVRGLEILKCFQPGERLLGNKDLARRTGIPKPTVSRLTYTLTRMGYLNYSENLG